MLSDLVIESLEKMAFKANGLTSATLIGEHEDEKEKNPDAPSHIEGAMLHAIGHHAAHLKEALKTGNQAKANFHGNMYGKYMKLGDSMKNKIGVKDFNFESVSPKPWQLQVRLGDHNLNRKMVNFGGDMKAGENSRSAPGWKDGANRGYDWMRLHPHPEHRDAFPIVNPDKSVKEFEHSRKPYPIEKVSINGRQIVLPDVKNSSTNVSHPLDFHPTVKNVHNVNNKAKSKNVDVDKELEDYDTHHRGVVAGLAPHQPAEVPEVEDAPQHDILSDEELDSLGGYSQHQPTEAPKVEAKVEEAPQDNSLSDEELDSLV